MRHPLFIPITIISVFIAALAACQDRYPNRRVLGETFPKISGVSLDQKRWELPRDWRGQPTIALLGYVQDAQFDIDRWLIGLDMTQTRAPIYEVPTIKGLIPRMISGKINEGMRGGIPEPIWSAVITVYRDGEQTQRFTGNVNPRNARVILIDAGGVIRFFTDEGFSVSGLNRLRAELTRLSESPRSSSSPQRSSSDEARGEARDETPSSNAQPKHNPTDQRGAQ